jgi:hypothetical protein
MDKIKLLIPFDKRTGEFMEYAWSDRPDYYEWKENYEWEDILEYIGYSRGCSSVKLHMVSELNGKKYAMFISDFDDILKKHGFSVFGEKHTYTFCKKGANYGIKFVR